MANGGLIGVDNDPVSQDELVTTFTSTGIFTTQPETTGVSYLVVAGGGASAGGGGGAGGFRTVTDDSFSVSGNSLYPVIVGAGGAGPVGPSPVAAGSGVETNCYKGSDSVFSTITSAGGGQGGRITGRVPTHPTGLNLGIGYSGGSGGGGGNMDVSSVSPAGTDNEGSGNTPPVSPPQGNDGGAKQNGTAGALSGGGGAGAVGADGGGPAGTYPGDGGAGTANYLRVHAAADSYAKLLIHSDTTDGSTTFTDSSSSGHTITVNGNTHHETDQEVVGDTSIYFDGTGDYLSIPDSDDWNFGSGDMTYEFWLRPESVSGIQVLLGQYQSYSENMALYMNNGGLVWEDKHNSSHSGRQVATDSTSLMSTSSWYHVAVVKNGSNAKIYVDGIERGSASFSAGTDFSAAIEIGGQDSGSAYMYTGYMDEIRVSKGIARYTQNFTIIYAGGGGGGRNEPGGAHGTGGAGGGGDGDSTVNGTGTAGTANTGGGAGGGGMASGGIRGAGNSGGSGIVIIKEPAITATHSGIWNMDDLYTYVSEDKWV